MTSLRQIAEVIRQQRRSYVPILVPLPAANVGVFLMEALAKLLPIVPLTSAVQIAFLTRGWRPDATRATKELGWKPMPLEDGVEHFLSGISGTDAAGFPVSGFRLRREGPKPA
jgi:nucleoside-diphosphate-sugar epimerase